jgi:PAS domain S-box-containing protein
MTGKGAVLVVDDESASLSLVTALLTSEGYDVRQAGSGRLALASIASKAPDLILLDLRLAGMDGLEVCRRIKACDGCRDIPLIILSHSTELHDYKQGLAMGAVDFVSKPVRREELLARIRTHLELSRLRAHPGSRANERTADLHTTIERLTSELAERARAEEVLHAREELFRAMFEQATVGVVQSSLDGRVLAANRRFCEMVGYTALELLESRFRDITHPEDVDVSAEFVRKLLADEISSYRIEKRYIRKDGSIVWVNLYASLLRLGRDKAEPRLFAIVEDISDRKRAEQRLERQIAFDNLVSDLLTRFATCSAPEIDAAIMRGLGLLSEFLPADYGYVVQLSDTRQTWSVTHEWCGPDTPPYISQLQNLPISTVSWLARKTLGGEVVQVDSIQELPPDAEADREFHAQRGVSATISAPMVDIDGRVFGVVGVHRRGPSSAWAVGDAERLRTIGEAIAGVLQRKRSEKALRDSEERFRSLADTAPVIMWVTDAQKRITFCNKHALDFWGTTREEVARGGRQFIHPDDLSRNEAAMLAAVDQHVPFSVELRLKRADGQYRDTLVSGAPRFVSGVYQGHVGTGVDITDVKRTYERHMAAQKLESLGVLAAGVAHDFNNLLGGIVAAADSLRAELPSDSPAREDVEQIRNVALRAADVVSQLMAFAGQESPRPAMIELSPLIGEMSELLKVSIAKTTAMHTSLEKDLPPVRANVVELRQVILNLVTNASEALGGKAGSITIATRRSTAGQQRGSTAEYVELEVTDTGCGMTDDVRERIFDPFFTTKFPGRGLGLSAVQGIVRRYGGLINVESAPGQGSRFTVLLPTTTERPLSLDVPAGVADVSTVTGTVLVVEDEDTLRSTISRMLRKRGFAVVEAADGRSAVDLFRTCHHTIGVVLLDVTLPKMRCAEVLTELRLIRPDTKVVLSSGYSREMVMGEIGANPVSGFIRKPYTVSDVVTMLRAALSE